MPVGKTSALCFPLTAAHAERGRGGTRLHGDGAWQLQKQLLHTNSENILGVRKRDLAAWCMGAWQMSKLNRQGHDARHHDLFAKLSAQAVSALLLM